MHTPSTRESQMSQNQNIAMSPRTKASKILDDGPTVEANDSSDDSEDVPPSDKDEDANSNDDDDERNQIRSDLSTMSFEQLLKLKEQLGTKVYNEAIFGKDAKSSRSNKTKTEFKRANKNRPREMCSKRPVPFLGGEHRTKTTESKNTRDPRFDEKCGDYNSRIFKNNYEFVNEIREKEVRQLKKKLRKTEDETNRKDMKLAVQRLENQVREEKKRKIRDGVLLEQKEEMKKAREEGKPAWHRTKKEQKVTELVKQYEHLKKSGGLTKHLEKRRKKNASKDRKKLDSSM